MAKPEKTRGITRRHDNDAIFISYDEIPRANYNPTNGYGNVNGTFFDTGAVPNFTAGPVANFANGGASFTDARSLSPARPRAFYVGLKATF